MNWEIFVAINIVTISFARILQKKLLSDPKSDSLAFSIIFQVINGIFIAIFALLSQDVFFDYDNLFPNFIFTTVLYMLAGVFFFQALKLADGSTVSLILSITSAWTILSSMYFLDERLKVNEVIGIILILASVLLVSYQGFSKLKFKKGEVYALASSIFFGLALTNDFYIIRDDTPYTYLSASFLIPGIFTAIVFPKNAKKISWFFSKKMVLKFFLVCCLYTIGFVSIFLAYQNGGQGSIIYPVSQMSVILIVLLSIFFLNEKKDLKVKLLASIISVAGVALTAIK
jgi:uncharacterized membrane protein